MIGGSSMNTLWPWLTIGMSGVVGHQQAGVLLPPPKDLTSGSSLAPSDPVCPSLRTELDCALELTEVATYTLPPGMVVAGAALSPDGARLSGLGVPAEESSVLRACRRGPIGFV